jgi:signal transduction histidine kinase/ligand-binding sensor domain-containing protein
LYSDEIKIINRKFEKINVNSGLSQNTVHKVFQDKEGYLWFATPDGLNRYDGYEIEIFRNNTEDSSSISDNFINSIFPSKNYGFWVTTDNGLNYYNSKTGKFSRYLENLNIKFLQGIETNNNLILLLGVSSSGFKFYNYNIKTKQFHKFSINDELISNPNIKFKIGKNGELWILGLSGLYQFDLVSESAKQILPKSSDNTIFTDIETDSYGNYYISTFNDIYYISKDFKEIQNLNITYNFNSIRFLIFDNNGNLYFGGDYKIGLGQYNTNTKRTSILEIEKNLDDHNNQLIISCLIDYSGIIWLGIDGVGILKLIDETHKFNTYIYDHKNKNSLSNNFPKGLLVDSRNNLWVCTVLGGLNRYDINSSQWINFNENETGKLKISNNTGMVVFEDSQKRIWYGGGPSIDTFNYEINQFKPAFKESATHIIYEDSGGYYWTGSTNRILIRHNLKDGSYKSIFDLIDNKSTFLATNVYSLLEDKKGIFWIGTDFGLYKLEISKRKIFRYSNNTNNKFSLSNNFITCLMKDNKSRIWICTRDGINIFNEKENNFFKLRTNHGLPNSFVYGIIQTSDSIFWISTNKGLGKLTFVNQNNFKFHNFTISDGLNSNEFNTNSYYKSKNGYLYFGGLGGLVYFHPDSIVENRKIPNVVITKVKLFDVDYQFKEILWLAKELIFPYYDNTLSFEFVALEFTKPESNQYAYYMEGVDTGWVYSSDRRFARYANLKPGLYKFRVKASNNDNVWNEKGTSIVIRILPPFWQTPIFIISVIMLIVFILAFIYNYRSKLIRNRNIALMEKVNQSTDEIRTKNELLEQKTNEITKINQSLEKRVEDRTFELQTTNQQLQQLIQEVTLSKSESLKSIIKAQEDERSRFAKDLHDGAGQFLAFLKFNLSNISSKLENENFDAKSAMNEQIKIVDEIVKDLRQFAYALMPPVLERVGLNAAIEELVEMYKTSTNIRFDYYIQEKKKPIAKYNKIHIYRIVQEILSNSVKHSNCTKIHVQLLTYPNNMLIIIEDNGKGFDISKEKNGMGLTNIFSRVALINGKIDIDTQINHGTTITVEVPN